ncbi:MAG: ABC transporter permease [Actinomycetota bacterium]|nr:ABC transporter permease [Actinomycetota bacterium]
MSAEAVVTSGIATTLELSTPIVFGGLGGVLSERSGVLNIALEGTMLVGAFGYFAGAAATGTVIGGIVLAVAAATSGALVLAWLAIHANADQVIAGMAVNLIASGLTDFLYQAIYGVSGTAPVPGMGPVGIPLLDKIPVVGPSLFDQSLLTYLALLAVPAVSFWLFRTRAGLHVLAVGERPEAADSAGLGVYKIRYLSVAASGVACGLGGAFILTQVSSFSSDMTAGVGYIALAAVIFGNWRPRGVLVAAVLFGAFEALQSILQSLGVSVPYDLLLAVPYLVTIVAVSGFVGRVRAPQADGVPYVRS